MRRAPGDAARLPSASPGARSGSDCQRGDSRSCAAAACRYPCGVPRWTRCAARPCEVTCGASLCAVTSCAGMSSVGCGCRARCRTASTCAGRSAWSSRGSSHGRRGSSSENCSTIGCAPSLPSSRGGTVPSASSCCSSRSSGSIGAPSSSCAARWNGSTASCSSATARSCSRAWNWGSWSGLSAAVSSLASA